MLDNKSVRTKPRRNWNFVYKSLLPISTFTLFFTSTSTAQTIVEARPSSPDDTVVGWKLKTGKSLNPVFIPKDKHKSTINTIKSFAELDPFQIETVAGKTNLTPGISNNLQSHLSSKTKSNANETTIVIVTPTLPVQRPLEKSLAADGLEILAFVPSNSYVARATPEVIKLVAQREDIYSISTVPPHLKASPDLQEIKTYINDRRKSGDLFHQEEISIIITCYDRISQNTVRNAITGAGAEILYENEFDPTLRINLKDWNLLNRLTAMPDVAYIETDPLVETTLDTSVAFINHTSLQNDSANKWGSKVSIGMIDTGFQIFHNAFHGVQSLGWNVSGDGGGPFVDYGGHGTHVAGIMLGGTMDSSFTGVNPWSGRTAESTFYQVRCTNSRNLRALYNTDRALNTLRTNNKALVTNNSWGSTGDRFGTNASSVLVDTIIWNTGLIHVFAAGNDGRSGNITIGSPGGAKNAITVGSLTNTPDLSISDFSSRGPTLDGRAKPEIYAPGDPINAADASKLDGLVAYSGTSMAAPHVTAVIASLIGQDQHLKARQPHVAKALLMAGAKRAENLPSFTGVLNSHDTHHNTPTSQIITASRENAASYKDTIWDIEIPTGTLNATFILAWVEPPAITGSPRALINDIDLKIIAPNGNVYDSRSSANNFEHLEIPNPIPGIYTVSADKFMVRDQYHLGLAVKLETEDICIYRTTPKTAKLDSTQNVGNFNLIVNKPGQCEWSASSNASWLKITGVTTGTATATISYECSPNTDSSPRTGVISVAGQTHTVTQLGLKPPCLFTISPENHTAGAQAGGGELNVTVNMDNQCLWEATTDVPWINISHPRTGISNGTVRYNFDKNQSNQTRVGIISVGDKTLTVIQNPVSSDPTPANGPDVGISKGKLKTNSKKMKGQIVCKIDNHSKETLTNLKLRLITRYEESEILLAETPVKQLKASTKKTKSVSQKLKFTYSEDVVGEDVWAVVVSENDSNPENNYFYLGQLQ